MNESDARLLLSLVAEPGDPRLVAALAEHGARGLVEILRSGERRDGPPLPASWSEALPDRERSLDRVRARADDAGLRWIVPGHREWPVSLDDLDHLAPHGSSVGRPLGLWLRGAGRLAPLADGSVAIVGARTCTAYGADCAADIAADLADQGRTVVSGAAFGIDAAAHRGALAQGRPSIAVLACGADVDYPRTHAALLTRVAADGVVVSEQAPGETPMRSRFLSRNRIIAALAVGTVVVEAARRSGSLNTLSWADALGRVTMALPGPVTSQQSSGTHQAVRDGRAVLVTDGRDVLEAVSEPGTLPELTPEGESDRLGLLARRVLDALSFTEARTTAEVAAAARGSRTDVADLLTGLSRRGLCAHVGDRWLVLPASARSRD